MRKFIWLAFVLGVFIVTPLSAQIIVMRAILRPSGTPPPPPPAGVENLIDFDDWSVLQNQAWSQTTQPANERALIVLPKNDSGNMAPTLVLDPTGGIGGTQALRLDVAAGSNRLPGFWVYPMMGGFVTPSGSAKYLLGVPASHLIFNVRFPAGYRETSAASQPPAYPNHQSIHLGTYSAKAAGNAFEDYNWHFYHQIWVRHDIANAGEWLTIKFNSLPSHQRSRNEEYSFEPTYYEPDTGNVHGGYFETLTRIYFDNVPYNSSPQISLPYSIWIDSIQYVPGDPTSVFTIVPQDYTEGQEYGSRSFTTRVTASEAITAWVQPFGFANFTRASYTWTASESKDFVWTTSPITSRRPAGLNIIPDDEYEITATTANPSNIEPVIENRWYQTDGRVDAEGIGNTQIYTIQ